MDHYFYISFSTIPSGDKKQDVLPRRHDDAAEEPSDGMQHEGDERVSGINEADSGCNMASGNSENSKNDMAVLSANTDRDDSSAQSESSAEEHTRFPDTSDDFLSNESSSTGRYKTRTGSTRTGSDRINSDQSGSDQVGSTRIDSDRQKINKLRNILKFYLIVGLIPLRNWPFTRHFDF